MGSLPERLRSLGGDIYGALEKLAVPVFVLDTRAVIVWANAAATRRFGDLAGRSAWSVIAPDSLPAARERFARKLLAVDVATEARVSLRTADGSIVAGDISTVALEREGHVVGVFGLVDVDDLDGVVTPSPHVELTPRQAEVLRYLAAGYTTAQMAERMGVSTETVRNHVRHLLRRLRVHSRLAAVVRAHELGLLGA